MASTATKTVPQAVRTESSTAANWGGTGIAIGSLAVVVTSALYLASPQAAAMPHAILDVTAAVDGAVRGRATMHFAGFFGILGDVTITAAAVVIAIDQLARRQVATSVGWILIAICTILFAIVDTTVGYVLSPVAAQPSGTAAFVAVKSLFDALFLLGTATFGAGAVLALGATALGKSRQPHRALAVPGVAIGLAGAVAAILCLIGLDLHVLIGPSVAGNAVIFSLVGLQIARSSRHRAAEVCD